MTHGEAAARARAGGDFAAQSSPAREAALLAARSCGPCREADCALEAAPEARRRNASLYKAPPEILAIIEAASMLTRVDFDYLLRTAALESSFDPAREVKTSSAVGLYQFVEQTWFHMMQEIGGEFGLEDVTGAIAAGEGGYEVADADARAEILRLRYEPELSALFAGMFTRRNAEFLAKALGREPDPGELYVAHVMGAAGAAELIRLAAEEPDAKANKHFARAARANRTIFFEDKKPRTVAEVLDILRNKYWKIPVYAEDHAPWISAPLPAWGPLPAPLMGGDELLYAAN